MCVYKQADNIRSMGLSRAKNERLHFMLKSFIKNDLFYVSSLPYARSLTCFAMIDDAVGYIPNPSGGMAL